MKPLFNALPSKNGQQGFTLIELMVALVIGLVVVLSAGKLFLVGLQGFKTVEMLGNKQEALNFSATTLVRDVRRASVDDLGNPFVYFSDDDNLLEVTFANDGDIEGCNDDLVSRFYRLDSDLVEDKGYTLEMAQQCSSETSDPVFRPLVTGFAAEGFDCSEGCAGKGALRLYLELYSDVPGEGDSVDFYVVNRTHKMEILN